MRTIGIITASLMIALVSAGPALAVAQETKAETAIDSEEALDEALKRFGYLAGQALTCVTDAQKPELEREVLNVNNSIARLLGVDRAFLFSSSFGYGTSVKVPTEECAELLKTYASRVAKHRAAAGGSL
jgi:hypothetical protein